jgi:hypothetical protein
MRISRVFVALVTTAVLIASTAAVEGQAAPSVVIYYLGWDTEYPARLSPEAAREFASIVVTIHDPIEASKVRQRLDLSAMKSRDAEPEDARLVIDFMEGDQKTESFYASRFNLLSQDSTRARVIDENFRRHFRFLEGH